MNYYSEMLERAKRAQIDTLTLMVADETKAIFGKNHPNFETLCCVMEDLYLNTYHIALDTLGNALLYAIEKEHIELSKIHKHSEEFDLVVELACSMD